LLSVVSALVFALIYIELLVIESCSSLTMTVLGVTKELLLIVLAIAFRGEQVAPIKCFGFCMCLLGVALFEYSKAGRKCLFVVAESNKEHV
jgi:solute carrier family 35 protein C2